MLLVTYPFGTCKCATFAVSSVLSRRVSPPHVAWIRVLTAKPTGFKRADVRRSVEQNESRPVCRSGCARVRPRRPTPRKNRSAEWPGGRFHTGPWMGRRAGCVRQFADCADKPRGPSRLPQPIGPTGHRPPACRVALHRHANSLLLLSYSAESVCSTRV